MDDVTIVRNLDVITGEIVAIKNQTARMLLDNSIEIGRRLVEAKSQLKHGEWGTWLSEKLDFSQTTANNLMRVFEEYGDPQGSFFGATAKSPALGNLSYTKALMLLAVPSEEREDFIEAHNVSELSTRELERVIRERDAAIAEKELAEQAKNDFAERVRSAEELAAEAQREADDSTSALHDALNELANLRAAESKPAEINPEYLAELKNEADKEAKAAAEAEIINKVQAAEEKVAAAEAAKAEADRALASAEQERDRLREAREAERADTAEKIERLEKQLVAASSETVTVFKTLFANVQELLNRLLDCMKQLNEDPETQKKLSTALCALCEKTIEAAGEYR